MENPKPEKVAAINEVKERFSSASSVVVTEYRGLSVDSLSELRRTLRPVGGSYKVYKNTLVRRAASEAGLELDEHLTGPTALAFTEKTPDGEDGDVVTVAKTLRDFGKTHPELVIKGGYFDGSPVDAEGINALADVEPREVLLAKFAGLLAAPMTQFAGLLEALPRDFAYGLQALIEKGGAADAPAAEAATEKPESETSGEETSKEEAPAAEDTAEAPEAKADDSNETETNDEPAADAADQADENGDN